MAETGAISYVVKRDTWDDVIKHSEILLKSGIQTEYYYDGYVPAVEQYSSPTIESNEDPKESPLYRPSVSRERAHLNYYKSSWYFTKKDLNEMNAASVTINHINQVASKAGKMIDKLTLQEGPGSLDWEVKYAKQVVPWNITNIDFREDLNNIVGIRSHQIVKAKELYKEICDCDKSEDEMFIIMPAMALSILTSGENNDWSKTGMVKTPFDNEIKIRTMHGIRCIALSNQTFKDAGLEVKVGGFPGYYAFLLSNDALLATIGGAKADNGVEMGMLNVQVAAPSEKYATGRIVTFEYGAMVAHSDRIICIPFRTRSA